VDFNVLEEDCIFCKKCDSACPENAISVIKPFRGSLQVDTDLCPEGCQICADICPTETLSIDEDKHLVITEEFCIYCAACQQVCPENAIQVDRTAVLHTDVKSGAWVKALEKLTSFSFVAKEIRSKSGKKRQALIKTLGRS
jgi:4Fe-4S ferredoxin